MFFFFFFNDTATTEIYTLSLHDALPISLHPDEASRAHAAGTDRARRRHVARSEEHTSELQSHSDLVCRLLLEKKKKQQTMKANITDSTQERMLQRHGCHPDRLSEVHHSS